jgi:hypothetical protein
MHYAVTDTPQNYQNRANEKKHMGLMSWAKAPDGKILKPDILIAKNYSKRELEPRA